MEEYGKKPAVRIVKKAKKKRVVQQTNGDARVR